MGKAKGRKAKGTALGADGVHLKLRSSRNLDKMTLQKMSSTRNQITISNSNLEENGPKYEKYSSLNQASLKKQKYELADSISAFRQSGHFLKPDPADKYLDKSPKLKVKLNNKGIKNRFRSY